MKGILKDGVIISKTDSPNFKTLSICEVDKNFIFLKYQIDFAKFISKYYFSSLSEALSLFTPHKIVKSPNKTTFLSLPLPKLSLAQQNAYHWII